MFTERKELTEQEKAVVDALLSPYGTELTISGVHRKAKDTLPKDANVIELLESLEMRGYLKTRFIQMPGYLVKRRVFSVNHSHLYFESKGRLQTRTILARIARHPIPA